MILIADSGSTKTDWRLIAPDGSIGQAKTKGFNPYYQDGEEIAEELKNVLKPQMLAQPTEVHYYGAGCSSEANCNKVREAIKGVFGDIKVEVNHDMLAAARSLCGHESGIACILGTGANACLYDGEEIIDQAPSPGYLLGDEGAGSYIGKQILIHFLYKELPTHLMAAFEKRYKTSKTEILENVYQKSMPSKYMAGFSQFAFHHLSDPFIYRMVYNAFQLFFERNVEKFENYKSQKVHFTGSVAFYYSNLLRQVANDRGIMVKNILESPIAGLALYHSEKK